VGQIAASLKWPNDLVVDGRKLAGLLAEAVDGAVVVGVGLNVSTRSAELPRADATSLAIETGRPMDRQPLLLAVLRAVAVAYAPWVSSGGSAAAVLPGYRARCATVGARVEVALPSGEILAGTAVDVDDYGRLIVRSAAGERAVSAGDVRHVRPVG
jgi:BirA family biotin operon repressor/biotin-[acetyl-CoA-carboxylase] ligase